MDGRKTIASYIVLNRIKNGQGKKEDLLKEYNLTEEEFDRATKSDLELAKVNTFLMPDDNEQRQAEDEARDQYDAEQEALQKEDIEKETGWRER